MTTGYFPVRTILNNKLSRKEQFSMHCRYGFHYFDQKDLALFSARFLIYLIVHLG